MSTTQSADVETILSILHLESKPLNPSQLLRKLPKDLNLSEESLTEILDSEVESRRIFKFQPYNSRPPKYRYWDRDVREYAKLVIQERLNKNEFSKKELANNVKNELRDCKQNEVWKYLGELVEEGIVDELPCVPGSSTKRYSVNAPDPKKYLKRAVTDICKQADKLSRYQLTKQIVLETAISMIQADLEPENKIPSQLEPKMTDQEILHHLNGLTSFKTEGISRQHLSDSLDIDKASLDQALYRLQKDKKLQLSILENGESIQPLREPSQAEITDCIHKQYDRLASLVSNNGLVPIHQLRSLAKEAFTNLDQNLFDDALRSLRTRGFRLSPISNTQLASMEELDASIPGMGNEILFYLERV